MTNKLLMGLVIFILLNMVSCCLLMVGVVISGAVYFITGTDPGGIALGERLISNGYPMIYLSVWSIAAIAALTVLMLTALAIFIKTVIKKEV